LVRYRKRRSVAYFLPLDLEKAHGLVEKQSSSMIFTLKGRRGRAIVDNLIELIGGTAPVVLVNGPGHRTMNFQLPTTSHKRFDKLTEY
jgi:hypothetical protein